MKKRTAKSAKIAKKRPNEAPLRSSRALRFNEELEKHMAKDLEAVAKDIVDAAFKVHKEFGPGLLESAYQQCHAYELRKRGRQVLTEVVLPIVYDGQKIDSGYRIDMIVDNLIIAENKTVETLLPIHTAQLITYLKLKDCRLGFLINWNVKLIKNGIVVSQTA